MGLHSVISEFAFVMFRLVVFYFLFMVFSCFIRTDVFFAIPFHVLILKLSASRVLVHVSAPPRLENAVADTQHRLGRLERRMARDNGQLERVVGHVQGHVESIGGALRDMLRIMRSMHSGCLSLRERPGLPVYMSFSSVSDVILVFFFCFDELIMRCIS